MTEPTHLSAEGFATEIDAAAQALIDKTGCNLTAAYRQAGIDSLDAARRELAAKTELLANIKALGRVTMATESGRELIMKAITEVLAAPPSEHSEGKQEP